MKNNFCIEFNGRGCEVEIPGERVISEEKESESGVYYMLTEVFLSAKEVTVCIYAVGNIGDIGIRLYCPTAEEMQRVETLLYNFFGPEGVKELLGDTE